MNENDGRELTENKLDNLIAFFPPIFLFCEKSGIEATGLAWQCN